VGRADHAHVDRVLLPPAQPLDGARLEEAQQLGLQRLRQVADFSGIAAQLIATKRPGRLLAACRPCASTSLPVPLSPSSSTVALLVATRSIVRATRSICGSRVSRPPRASPVDCSCSRRFSACSSASRSARSIVSRSTSGSNGLARKS